MKKIVLVAAALSALAPAAFANTLVLSPSQESEVRRYLPDADLDNLSTQTVQVIANVLNGDGENIRGKLYQALNS